jgi:hypothetical protein
MIGKQQAGSGCAAARPIERISTMCALAQGLGATGWPVKRLPGLALLLVLALAGLVGCSAARLPQAATPAAQALAPSRLAEQYGLRVNLVAVTAGGGLVDVRIMILDAGKAAALLGDGKAFPVLRVPGRNVALHVPDALANQVAQPVKFATGEMIHLTYPNAGDAVQRGTPVTLEFGGVALAPVAAQR